MQNSDPIGSAIWDFYTQNNPQDITVECDIMEDDYIPVDYLFRKYKDFPELEKEAMGRVKGTVLDVGAAAGPHAVYLSEKGHDISTIEISPKAHQYLKERLPNATHYLTDVLDFNKGGFDTILLMMNGIGIAKTFDNVVPFLKHLASLLNEGGSILCESTDVLDIFQDEEGGLWIDLNAAYYGEFNFNMKYKDVESGWFTWLYLDRVNFEKLANQAGLNIIFVYENENSFLVELKK